MQRHGHGGGGCAGRSSDRWDRGGQNSGAGDRFCAYQGSGLADIRFPNQAGYEACLEILDLIDRAGPEDLFLCVMSGGSSALMSCPVDGISLEDEQKTTDILLKSGAGILRDQRGAATHLPHERRQDGPADCGPGGGTHRLQHQRFRVQSAHQGHFHTLGALLRHPMGPDQTTFRTLWPASKSTISGQPPASVRDPYLASCGPAGGDAQRPFPKIHTIKSTPCRTALRPHSAAEQLGLRAVVLSTFIEGEAKDMGTLMASIAREIQAYRPSRSAPLCPLISVGESVTTIPQEDCVITGHGGPSQEMALSFAVTAAKAKGCLSALH